MSNNNEDKELKPLKIVVEFDEYSFDFFEFKSKEFLNNYNDKKPHFMDYTMRLNFVNRFTGEYSKEFHYNTEEHRLEKWNELKKKLTGLRIHFE